MTDSPADVHQLEPTIGAFARSRRRELRLSQRDLAELAGVSERTIRAIEQDKQTIRLDVLRAVLDTLGGELRVGVRLV